MPRERIIQLFEYEELRIGDKIGGVELVEKDRKLLSRLHRQTGERYYDLTHNGVRFKQYVGVLKAGDLVIEVLPKGDRGVRKTLSTEEKLPWRELFVQILSRIGYIHNELGPRSSLFLQHGSLIDLYVMHFLTTVRSLCREGLVRSYIPRLKTREALKGQIQFSRQMICEARCTVGFDTRAAEYERGHILNRVIFTALQRVKETRLSRATQDILPEVLGYFEGVTSLNESTEIIKALRYDRRTERYRTAIDLAKPILLSAYPGVRSGIDDTFSMFFDMNRVWEQYIFCELRRYAAKRGVHVDRQVSASFWEDRTLRPDIVVHLGPDTRVVIDTKWKDLQRQKPSEGDLRQMFTYNHQIRAVHSILLYPDIHGTTGGGANFRQDTGFADHGCSYDFARIWRTQEGKISLNFDVGADVFGMVVRVVGGGR